MGIANELKKNNIKNCISLFGKKSGKKCNEVIGFGG